MDNLVELKSSTEDFDVEFEIVPVMNSEQQKIQQKIDEIDNRIDSAQQRITGLNTDIDRLTNHADGFDYAIAVSSGILAGLIDSFFVGEWNFEKAKAISNEEINKKVTEFAKKDPRYKEWLKKRRGTDDEDNLENAINFLEEKFHLPGDGAYNVKNDDSNYEMLKNITHKTHRIDDMCHHPTPFGLICCIIVQFTGHTMYCDKTSTWVKIPVTVNEYGNFVGKNPLSKLFSGIINWFMTVGKTAANQKGHLMSDMATSSGIPGSFLSTLKELSSLPCFKDSKFGENLRKAFQNGIGTGDKQVDLGVFNSLFEGASSKFDMRTEMAVKHELKRQTLPVVINEVVVRAVYFVRRFIEQAKKQRELQSLDWKSMIPVNNRTIARMMTIASGTFVAVDMADAAIRAAVKSGCVDPATFASNFILRVNFVGIGRFAIAVGVDIGMGVKRGRLRDERIKVYSELLLLNNAKVYYKQAQGDYLLEECAKSEEKLWITLADNEQAMMEAIHLYENALVGVVTSYQKNKEIISEISAYVSQIKEKNPDLIDYLLDRL